MSTIDIDPKIYRDKIAECRMMIAEREIQLSATVDPLVAGTLERSIRTLTELLATYEKIAVNLEELRRESSRQLGPAQLPRRK